MTSVAPSILSADFSAMGEACELLEQNGADYIHCDVMDGCFVEQITFGHKMVAAVKKHTLLPLDVHLMIVEPEKHLKKFCEAGSDIITLHYEAIKHNVNECAEIIKSHGVKFGISVKPGTDVKEIEKYLPVADLVLIMSVEPGKGGQKFMDSALDKIAFCKKYKDDYNPRLLIEVDGGINEETGKLCADAGADILVAGSYVFKTEDMKKAIASLKQL